MNQELYYQRYAREHHAELLDIAKEARRARTASKAAADEQDDQGTIKYSALHEEPSDWKTSRAALLALVGLSLLLYGLIRFSKTSEVIAGDVNGSGSERQVRWMMGEGIRRLAPDNIGRIGKHLAGIDTTPKHVLPEGPRRWVWLVEEPGIFSPQACCLENDSAVDGSDTANG